MNILKNRKLEEFSEVIIFGAGYFGKLLIYLCQYKGIKVVTCFDNELSKQQNLIMNDVFCESPRFIENIPIIISLKNEEITKQLYNQCLKLGYADIININSDEIEKEINNLPDKEFCEIKYAILFGGKIPNWNNPKTFNEKLQWLKIFDRNPNYTKMVDKYCVKQYVAELIGEEYIIPTLGLWESFEEIEFDKLPNQFVLKCTHDSGSTVICKDKNTWNKEIAKYKLNKCLKRNYYNEGREWPYKNVKPQIICEEYLDNNGSELIDYKLMCFNGKVKCSFVCSNRDENGNLLVNFYDREWNPLPFIRHYPKRKEEFDKPINYKKMVCLAEKLAENMTFIRVDFYVNNQKILFGELTFYPGNGMEEFVPSVWDEKLGNWLNL